MLPVSIYSWWGCRDNFKTMSPFVHIIPTWARIETRLRHVEALEVVWDGLELTETNWNTFEEVWGMLWHLMDDWDKCHRRLVGFTMIWDDLCWIWVEWSDVETSGWRFERSLAHWLWVGKVWGLIEERWRIAALRLWIRWAKTNLGRDYNKF